MTVKLNCLELVVPDYLKVGNCAKVVDGNVEKPVTKILRTDGPLAQESAALAVDFPHCCRALRFIKIRRRNRRETMNPRRLESILPQKLRSKIDCGSPK